MAKKVILNLKNPKYGQAGEPEYIQVPAGVGYDGEFYKRISQLEKLEYNATQVTGNGYASLTEALNSVTQEKYKVNGIVLTWYDTTEQGWKSMRYIGADSAGWATVENWVETGGGGEGGGTETYLLPSALMNMTSDTPSEDVLAAFGGMAEFEKLVEAAKAKNVGVEYEIITEQIPVPIKQRIPVMASLVVDGEVEGTKSTMIVLNYSIFDMFSGIISQYGLGFSREGDSIGLEKMEQKFPNLPNLDVSDAGLKGFFVRSNRIDVVNIFDELGYEGYKRIFLANKEPYQPKNGDIWIQTT